MHMCAMLAFLKITGQKANIWTEPDVYKRQIEDIEAAKETINVEYYILKRDKIGRRFINVLTEKAAQGVQVLSLIHI